MTFENCKPGTHEPEGPAEAQALEFAPSQALRRNPNITTWLFATLSLFEGSPAIQSLLMAVLLLLSGTVVHCLKALMPARRPLAHSLGDGRIAPVPCISRENCPARGF
jgi:hypothetical protein